MAAFLTDPSLTPDIAFWPCLSLSAWPVSYHTHLCWLTANKWETSWVVGTVPKRHFFTGLPLAWCSKCQINRLQLCLVNTKMGLLLPCKKNLSWTTPSIKVNQDPGSNANHYGAGTVVPTSAAETYPFPSIALILTYVDFYFFVLFFCFLIHGVSFY